ncbi:MAG TPA: lactate utilization protein C [Pseudogracilibacillus sp.]|nr:lactate utilization protein C [Pseudogracilibacillus sp.]
MVGREQFLQQIAENLGRGRITAGVKRPEWDGTPQWDVVQTTDKESLIEQFAAECDRVHTTFIRATKQSVADVLADEIERYGGGPIVYERHENDEWYGVSSLYHRLQDDGLTVEPYGVLTEKEQRELLVKANIGITYAAYALAESATVVLLHNEMNGRALSLLPTHYIALIPVDVLVPRLSHVTKAIREREQVDDVSASAISFVSGPSNSADIESNLVVGVHGPVKATYILIDS